MNRKKDSIDYESLLEAIIKIDMYRDMKVTRPEMLERLLIKSGVKGLRDILRKLKIEVDRVAGIMTRNKKFIKYTRLAVFFKFAAATGILLLFALIVMGEFLKNPLLFAIALWYPVIILTIVVLPNGFLITDYLARTELKIMKAKRSGGITKISKNLRDINQFLIDRLVESALRDGKHPKKLRFKIWHLDYNRVRVAKKPWILGKYWVVEPDIPEP